MTLITDINITRPTASGTNVGVSGELLCTPTRRRGLTNEVILPLAFRLTITDGVPDSPLNLDETSDDWGWELDERVDGGGRTWYTQVTSAADTKYSELPDVDGSTFQPLPDAQAAWVGALELKVDKTALDDESAELIDDPASAAALAVAAKIALETPLVIGNEVAKDFPTAVLVGDVGQWDAIIREQGNVVMDGDRYLMTYSGSVNPYAGNNVYVGIAESDDGIHWTKLGRIASITRSSEDPYLLKVGNVWHMYVEDKEEVPFKAIRKYHSADLVTWVDDGQVLTPSADAWEAQDVSSPVVWVDDARWHLLYEGRNLVPGNGMTGYAHSTDGIHWTKSASNPVIDAPGDFPWATQVVADDTFTYGSRRYVIGHAYNGTVFVFFMAVCLDDDYTQWTDAIGSRLRVRGYGSTDAMSSVQAIRTSADRLTIFYGLPNAIWRGMLSFPAEAFPTAAVATVTDDATVTTLDGAGAWLDLVTKTVTLPAGWTSALLQITGQVTLQALATTTTLRTVQTNMTIDAVNPGAGPQVSFPPVVATFSAAVEHSKAKVITANATVVVRGRVTSTDKDKTRTIGTTFIATLIRLS